MLNWMERIWGANIMWAIINWCWGSRPGNGIWLLNLNRSSWMVIEIVIMEIILGRMIIWFQIQIEVMRILKKDLNWTSWPIYHFRDINAFLEYLLSNKASVTRFIKKGIVNRNYNCDKHLNTEVFSFVNELFLAFLRLDALIIKDSQCANCPVKMSSKLSCSCKRKISWNTSSISQVHETG